MEDGNEDGNEDELKGKIIKLLFFLSNFFGWVLFGKDKAPYEVRIGAHSFGLDSSHDITMVMFKRKDGWQKNLRF